MGRRMTPGMRLMKSKQRATPSFKEEPKKAEAPKAAPKSAPKAAPKEAPKSAPKAAPAKKQSFKEAFAAAKDGSTFTWNGKSYKKEYAKPKKASAPAPKAAPKPAPKAAPSPAPATSGGTKLSKMQEAYRKAPPGPGKDQLGAQIAKQTKDLDGTGERKRKLAVANATRDALMGKPKDTRVDEIAAITKAGLKDRKGYKKGGLVKGYGKAKRGTKKCKMR